LAVLLFCLAVTSIRKRSGYFDDNIVKTEFNLPAYVSSMDIFCSEYSPHCFVLFLFFQELDSGEILFYMKGADAVMQNHVNYNDWLEEEVRNVFFFYSKK